MTKRPNNNYQKYHAHVYFDESTIDHARAICTQAGERFQVKVGRVHEKLVGPHPCWSCQLSFDYSQFDALIPWLEKHRNDLTVLVHALTGGDIEDHTTHAAWLGEEIPLELSFFRMLAERA